MGEMLHLSYYLPVEGKRTAGLRVDVNHKYETITGDGTERDHWTEISAFDGDLRQDVAVMTALLIASGIGNHPELVHSLAEKHAENGDEYEEIHEEIKDVREALQGWFVYETNDEDSRVGWTTHERWATLYLQKLTADGENEDDGEVELRMEEPTNRFLDCIDSLLAFVSDDSRRSRFEEVFDRTDLLELADEEPEGLGAYILRSVLGVGERRPALVPLYEFGSDRGVQIPSKWDDEIRADLFATLGRVCLGHGKYDDARDYHQRSLEIKEELGDLQGVANSLGNLGLVAQSQGAYDDARDYFRRANERLREIGAFRDAMDTFEPIVDVCEEMDDIESAIEWCERARDWAESVGLIDLSDAADRFEERREELAFDGEDVA
jgi:tetratricopeptide (TPR) repeat protein